MREGKRERDRERKAGERAGPEGRTSDKSWLGVETLREVDKAKGAGSAIPDGGE